MTKAKRTPPANRMQASRERNQNLYARARSAAERKVVAMIRETHPAIYEDMKRRVDIERAEETRTRRQASLRTDLCAWYRSAYCMEWGRLLEREIAELGGNIQLRTKC